MPNNPLTAEQLLGNLNEIERKFAPPQLYAAGNRRILEEGARVAVVGSRTASPAALARTRKLVGLLIDRGIVVVSGLAYGIDTAAHQAAIAKKGRTIAVIGTSLDEAYPKENKDLQDEIRRDHLLISQFASGYPIQRKNFPIRNRTMALIADATVIIEASDTSGSLSQGWEALRLGRGLFITKAVAENASLSWPEKMMPYGARILSDETVDEFIESLPQRTKAWVNDAVPF